ncbi:conserved hypothetical protein [Candidatus Sulfopaludibacter sp. SbA6]|nr:conserved hypothetical protein [Candidatus Sulfopaludibacter sp. SbA6]
MGTQSASTSTALDLLRMTDGLVIHQSLCATANLGIADLLKHGSRSTAHLAATLQANEDALYRTLRFLAGQGVFHEVAPRTFANSPLSEWLRTDVPGSVRSILIYRGSSFYFSPFADLLYSIETGAPAREKGLGVDGFEHLRRNPEDARIFDAAMTDLSMLWAPSVATAYDFGQWGSLMDVGGGNGLLLATIMRAHPALCGVLADQAQVLERARQCGFWPPDLAGRVHFEPVDFFQAVPPGCRAYLMKNIIHDWDDERARQILLNCRRAVPDDGVLLLVEYWVGSDNTPTLGKTIDLVMLALTGGKERTVEEHRELLASAGFWITRTIPVASDVMILEAKPTPHESGAF